MLQESLVEMTLVAKYCLEFRKDIRTWGAPGCYGYPAAILLFSIADSIGSYVIGGRTKKHFNILKHKEYYNLTLSDKKIDVIYKKFRCLLTHNTALPEGAQLSLGKKTDPVFQIINSNVRLNLIPFYYKTVNAGLKFLKNVKIIVPNSEQLKKILKASLSS
jgi:hypothetical protein